jgi:hypothetical protein
MTTGRKADDADAIRVNAPLGGMLPCEADGSLGIIQGLWSLG